MIFSFKFLDKLLKTESLKFKQFDFLKIHF